jgi:hypothetical protein
MGGLFSSPSLPPPPAPPPPPAQEGDPAVEEARRKELIAARKRAGRTATLLTGGYGDESIAPVATKTLLGE